MELNVKEIAMKLLEQNAKVIVSEIVKPLAVEMIQKSETKLDDILLPFVAQIEAAVLQLADKIHEEKAV
jgi:hypothetical protein